MVVVVPKISVDEVEVPVVFPYWLRWVVVSVPKISVVEVEVPMVLP